MIVCVCHRISERDIAHAVSEGCASFEALQFELGVGTRCGRCEECACETFHAHHQGHGLQAVGCAGAEAQAAHP